MYRPPRTTQSRFKANGRSMSYMPHAGGAGHGQTRQGVSWGLMSAQVETIIRSGGPVGNMQTYDVGFFDIPAHDAMPVPSSDEIVHRTGAPGEAKLLHGVPADRLMLSNEENKNHLIRIRRHNRAAVVRGAVKRAAVGRVLMNRNLPVADQLPLRTPDDYRLHVALTGETHRRPAPGPQAGRHIPMSAPLTPKSRTRREDIKTQRLQDAVTRLDEATGGGYAPYIRTAIANADRVKMAKSTPSYVQAVQTLAQISQQTASQAKAQEDKDYNLLRKRLSEKDAAELWNRGT